MMLDVGCGPNKREGYVGIDITPYPGVDVVHDLNSFPWPLPESAIDRIEIRNCLEHLDNTIAALRELHRIAKPGAEIFVEVPHFTSHDTYIDVSHTRTFSLFSFDYFRPDREATFPRDFALESVSRQLDFWPLNDRCGLKPAHVFGIHRLAASHPYFYERFLAYIFPARRIRFLLKVVKP
jgi:SAM-dependent methyltransferase